MRKLIGNIDLNPSSWISAETWRKRMITRHNIGEQPFAMNFLKTSGHTHFEEKSKSVSDQHQTTEASASAVWFCSSFHQYQESKQLLAGTLSAIGRLTGIND